MSKTISKRRKSQLIMRELHYYYRGHNVIQSTVSNIRSNADKITNNSLKNINDVSYKENTLPDNCHNMNDFIVEFNFDENNEKHYINTQDNVSEISDISDNNNESSLRKDIQKLISIRLGFRV